MSSLLIMLNIDPIQWTGSNKGQMVFLQAEAESDKVRVAARSSPPPSDEFLAIELADNSLNGIELHMIMLSDPTTSRFFIDHTDDGQQTMFGTFRRNKDAERSAMQHDQADRSSCAG